MPLTPKLSLPYPVLPDPADVPTDMGELAVAIDDKAAVANGLATLGSDGKVPTAQLPPAPGSIPPTIFDAKGDLLGASGPDVPVRIPVGSPGDVLVVDPAAPGGVRWATPAAGPINGTIIDAKGDLIVGTGADAAARLAAGANGYVLTADSTVSGGIKWSAAPGVGSAGISRDRRWNVGAGETSYDEFSGASLSGAYVRVDDTGGSGRLTWTQSDDLLIATNTGGDTSNQFSALVIPLSSVGGSLNTGDAFVTCLRLASTGANYVFGGLLFADGVTFGAGKQVVATTHYGGTSQDHFLRSYTNYTTLGTSVSQQTGVQLGTTYFVRLVYLGGTTWRRDLSSDGVLWSKGSATLTLSITPTHVGVLSTSFGTATAGQVSYEFLRRVSGIT